MHFTRNKLISLFLVSFYCLSVVMAEEECLGELMCYECESWNDERCADPFNTSVSYSHQPPILPCKGCCVKIVYNPKTNEETIRRTCLSSLQINLFLVDHVCMSESRGRSYMCFCEADGCNSAPKNLQDALLLSIGLLFLYACLKWPLYYVN